MKCKICRSNRVRRYLSNSQSTIMECNTCKVLFRDPFPLPKYSEERLKEEDVLKYYLGRIMKKPRNPKFRRELKNLEQLIPKGKLLDIGCATGHFLKIAKENGWEPYGVEINKPTGEYARKKLNLNVFIGTLEEADFPEATFDVVTLWNVLSQIRDLSSLMNEINHVLKPEGILVLEVSNRFSLLFKTKTLIFRYFRKHISRESSIFGKNQFYHFSPKSLKSILKQYDFPVIEFKKENEIWPNEEKIFSYSWFNEEVIRAIRFLCGILPKYSTHFIIYSKNLNGN